MEYERRIQLLDISLFDAIQSQTNNEEKQSLLLLQKNIREAGEFVYLEIGSHLGGTIQPFYGDPVCKLIYSIDKRPLIQPDERGRDFIYEENSTERMLENLKQVFPSVINKILTFDCDASQVDRARIKEKPCLCFIDGEHTDRAVYSDFEFCLDVCHPDAIIAFHDAWIVNRGIKHIKETLGRNAVLYKSMMLGGSIFVVLLNNAINNYAEKLAPYSHSETKYFKQMRFLLFVARLKNSAMRLMNIRQ